MRDTTMNIRQQFEDAFKRRVSSNPVQQSSSRIVGKLLDKTLTFGTLTKETLASPMIRFRRNQLGRINEADMLSASAKSVTASTVRNSISTPIQLSGSSGAGSGINGGRLKLRSDSFNVLNRSMSGDSDKMTSSVELARRHDRPRHQGIVLPVDFLLNRSFDGIETSILDDERQENPDVKTTLKQYRNIISEMNRTFEEKFVRICDDKDDVKNSLQRLENDDENLKKMEIKGKLAIIQINVLLLDLLT